MSGTGKDIDWSLVGPPPDDGHGHDTHKGDLSTNGPEVVGVCWMLVVLATLFLAARLYAKFTAHRGFWWDDHLLLASWFMFLAYVIITTYAVSQGLGTHDGSGLNDPSTMQFLIAISITFGSLGAAWSKTSFAITLLRITSRCVKVGLWCIVVTLNVFMMFNAILPYIWCQPANRGWSPTVQGQCWDRKITIQYSMFAAGYSAAMDIILAIIPWTVIMKLNMAINEKLGVAICMSLAVVAGVTSIVRCINVRLLYEEDFTYESGILAMWTAAELSVTIMAASIPVLRILIRNIVTHRSYSQSGGNGEFAGNTHTSVVSSKRGLKNSLSSSGGAESVTSLGLPRQDSRHIVKFETVTVDYERRSVSQGNNLDSYGFEMANVSPPKRQTSGRKF
ncbi:hypothetical protein SUNI508_03395 [Seiridium unicorne]|uniref:Rhodopsin domain-containing protein n=1 Tax=Seiridium unicorne TaxID=138068 RepID=A0ABR2VC85_9PEZI